MFHLEINSTSEGWRRLMVSSLALHVPGENKRRVRGSHTKDWLQLRREEDCHRPTPTPCSCLHIGHLHTSDHLTNL